MPWCPSKSQKIYNAATFEIISYQCINWVWFKLQDRNIWCWCELFFQILYWHKWIQTPWKKFSANLAMSRTKGAVLNFHKLLVYGIWDSCVLSTSWINVRSLRWVSKPLSTLLVLRIPTRVLVAFIWRILPGFRYSTKIASRTSNQEIKFVERRGMFQVLINFSQSPFLYTNSIRVIFITVWWYCFYTVFLQK